MLAVVRGGGDIATGVIQKLWHSGFKVVVLEVAAPTTIRRTVALSTAVQMGEARVEDMTALRAESLAMALQTLEEGKIPVLIDPEAKSLETLRPTFLVDAILAKRNLGTNRGMAPVTVGLGPGFTAPEEVDAVIETMRGHTLGRIIKKGQALADTGVPGEVGGKSTQRVVHAPCEGLVRHYRQIGDRVQQGETLFYLGDTPVPSPLSGVLRGLIAEGLQIEKGMKAADVDPRPSSQVDCDTISDKARSVGGAVLEACLWLGREKGLLKGFC